ncbi:MAG: HAD family hydrolase [Clostridia bacterium]|nr:HAD family hydrolase [Clostridia bacterium]
MKEYNCIIWDWNGTLLDDVPLNMEIVNTLLTERGKKPVESREYYLREFDFPVRDFYLKVGFDLENEDFSLIAREYASLYNENYPHADIFSDARDVLSLIKHSGKEQLIISATEQGYLLKQVAYFELEYFFTDILGSGNVLGSSKIETAKRWMKEKGYNPDEVLFVGDTLHDFETAKAIGCDCALVSRGHNSRERLEKTGCDVYDSLEFLKETVKK